jgi:hypothetical protein
MISPKDAAEAHSGSGLVRSLLVQLWQMDRALLEWGEAADLPPGMQISTWELIQTRQTIGRFKLWLMERYGTSLAG